MVKFTVDVRIIEKVNRDYAQQKQNRNKKKIESKSYRVRNGCKENEEKEENSDKWTKNKG